MSFNYYYLILIFSLFFSNSEGKLDDCPKSPNCVCTKATKARKKMKPIVYQQTAAEATTILKNLMANNLNSKLIFEDQGFLHFEVTTKTGKFTDDVVFQLDDHNKLIHFRSASRVGYSDLGANRRRMKRVTKWFASF